MRGCPCAGPVVAALRPTTYACNRSLPRAPQVAKHNVFTASVLSVQETNTWLGGTWRTVLAPNPDLNLLQGNQDHVPLEALHELQDAQRNILLQMAELEQQLAAAEAAELHHSTATSTPSPSTPPNNGAASISGLGVDTSAPFTSCEPASSTSTPPSHIQEAESGMQLVRWADALITSHLVRSKDHASAVIRSGPRQAMNAALPPMMELSAADAVGATPVIESADGMQRVRWAQTLITKGVQRVVDVARDSDARVLSRLQQQWEEELTRFHMEGQDVLQDLASLQHKHLRLVMSGEQHPLLPEWSRALADIRVLACVSAAEAKLGTAVCEVPPVSAVEEQRAELSAAVDVRSPANAAERQATAQPTSSMPISQQMVMSLQGAEEVTPLPAGTQILEAATVAQITTTGAEPARAGRDVSQDPPAWDIVGQLLKYHLRQGHSSAGVA